MDVIEQLKANLENYWETLIASIPKIAISLIILCSFILLAAFVGRIFRKRLYKNAQDSITITFLVRLVKIILVTVGIILAFHALGFTGIAGGLLAGAGVGAIAIGFAFKEIGENFLAGIILIFDRPFDIGDTVTINNNMGKVVGLQFRVTHLKTFDGKDAYIPNSTVITTDVYNHTRDGFLRQEFVIGIDYDDNIDKAIDAITKVVNDHSEVLRDEKTQVLINDFGTNTVNLKIMYWINTKDYKIGAQQTKTDIMKMVKRTLQQHKFGMPANIQEIKLYGNDPIPIELLDKTESKK